MTKIFGVDLSYAQSGISFSKLKQEGVKFTILRAGFTAYGDGVSKYKDEHFESFYKKAKSVGLGVGAYWFSCATTYAKGKAEAQFMYKNCLKGKKFEYPIYIDVEEKHTQGKVGKSAVTDAILGFCEYLSAKGYMVGVYANSSWFANKINTAKLTKYEKWVANWGKTRPKTPTNGMWQFGGETNLLRSNKVAGRVVDQDYAYKDYPTLMKQKGLNGFTQEFKVGTYQTLISMNIRTGPGSLSYRRKKVKELTVDGRKHATSKNLNANAAYKKGTKFTAKKIVKNISGNIWAQTPSGWICIKAGKKEYCVKI